MFRPYRNVSRLVLAKVKGIFVPSDLGPSLDDDPMLGAFVVELEREGGAGFYGKALYLVALAGVQ